MRQWKQGLKRYMSHYRAASTITIVRGVKMMEVVEVEEGAEERSWVLQ